MNIKKQFQYNPEIEVSVSQIGISKWNWVAYHSTIQNEPNEIMKNFRFDVLPINNDDGTVTSYYCTQEWNKYENLNKINIKDTHTIYYRLSLKDLIRKFKNEDRHYYFLTDYEQILGLVSYVNLNCQLVYNYLFFIISDIERSVSELLKEHVSQEQILTEFHKSKDEHLKNLATEFEKNIVNNEDSNIFQHMYLQTIGITLKKFTNELPKECKKLAKFSSKFGTQGVYNLIRQKVMHPVRPILSDKKSIHQIDELLTDYFEIKEIFEINTYT